MKTFNITSNVNKHVRKLERVQKKAIPAYLVKTVNDLALKVQEAEREALIKKTHKPKRDTLSAIKISKATRRKKPYNAIIFMHPQKYQKDGVKYVYTGGTERAKGDYYPSPIGGHTSTRTDKHGNPYRTKGGRNIRLTKTQFVGKAGKRDILGVWQRTGGKRNPSLELKFAFTPTIRHKKHLDYASEAKRAVKMNIRKISRNNLKSTIKKII